MQVLCAFDTWNEHQLSQLPEFLQFYPNLLRLTIDAKHDLSVEAWRNIAEAALTHCKKIHTLEVSSNRSLGDEGLAQIAGLIPKLKGLAVSYCNISDLGCSIFVTALCSQPCCELEWLHICGNNIGSDGYAALGRFIQHQDTNRPHARGKIVLDRKCREHETGRALETLSSKWKIDTWS